MTKKTTRPAQDVAQAGDHNSQLEKVRRYYNKRESRWGYRFLLGGTRHFGYYPEGSRHLSMRAAMREMENRLGEALALPEGSLVLDAGCGEGFVAFHLAEQFHLRVEGVDIVGESIARARQQASERGLDGNVHFKEGGYSQLDFPDATFDGVFTMETLVHAPDYRKALREFRRVLKPGGRLVLFEYSIPALDSVRPEDRDQFIEINTRAAMYSLPCFTHGRFPEILREADFNGVSVQDITERMTPMLRRFHQIAYLPFQLLRLLGREERFVNARSAVAGYEYRRYFGYNIVIGARP
jgi:sterol 24-C-methyltransferase